MKQHHRIATAVAAAVVVGGTAVGLVASRMDAPASADTASTETSSPAPEQGARQQLHDLKAGTREMTDRLTATKRALARQADAITRAKQAGSARSSGSGVLAQPAAPAPAAAPTPTVPASGWDDDRFDDHGRHHGDDDDDHFDDHGGHHDDDSDDDSGHDHGGHDDDGDDDD